LFVLKCKIDEMIILPHERSLVETNADYIRIQLLLYSLDMTD